MVQKLKMKLALTQNYRVTHLKFHFGFYFKKHMSTTSFLTPWKLNLEKTNLGINLQQCTSRLFERRSFLPWEICAWDLHLYERGDEIILTWIKGLTFNYSEIRSSIIRLHLFKNVFRSLRYQGLKSCIKRRHLLASQQNSSFLWRPLH